MIPNPIPLNNEVTMSLVVLTSAREVSYVQSTDLSFKPYRPYIFSTSIIINYHIHFNGIWRIFRKGPNLRPPYESCIYENVLIAYSNILKVKKRLTESRTKKTLIWCRPLLVPVLYIRIYSLHILTFGWGKKILSEHRTEEYFGTQS